MKAEINKDGVLIITPYTETEEYALKIWESSNYMPKQSMCIMPLCGNGMMLAQGASSEDRPINYNVPVGG